VAYLLFLDESGHDRKKSPYQVLAGIAIEDLNLWNLINAIHESEYRHFGARYSVEDRELKGKKLLKRKTYRLASQMPPIEEEYRRELAKQCLEQGETAGKDEITALSQAKIAFCGDVLDICGRFRCRVFASIVSREAPIPDDVGDYLRKDYVYLFERFFYFLEDLGTHQAGIGVFDEFEKSRSHMLVEQMSRYFKFTAKGKHRSSQIIPEPFFVHSDLTTGIQIADLTAYTINWGFRTGDMTEPNRQELDPLVDRICRLRYRTIREVEDNPEFVIWSFALIDDLRASQQDVE